MSKHLHYRPNPKEYISTLARIREESERQKRMLNEIYRRLPEHFDKYFKMYLQSPFFREEDIRFQELADLKLDLMSLGVSEGDIHLMLMHFVSNPSGVDFTTTYHEMVEEITSMEF